ncbi:MAG TPA: hypothetical protein VI248_10985, partial [Kineosporiaceae bacterium]
MLEENRQLREGNAELREDNTRLQERQAEQAQESERLHADLAVLRRLLFGRSTERSRPEPAGSADGPDAAGEGAGSVRGDGEKGEGFVGPDTLCFVM